MLTFFDYLRQRAFESVLLGAQEALEFLESQKTLSEPTKQLPQLSQIAVGDRTPTAPHPAEKKRENAPAKDSDEPLPAPRHRGRPMNRWKGKR